TRVLHAQAALGSGPAHYAADRLATPAASILNKRSHPCIRGVLLNNAARLGTDSLESSVADLSLFWRMATLLMPDMRRIALVVPALELSGGVPEVAAFICRAALRADRFDIQLISLSSSAV